MKNMRLLEQLVANADELQARTTLAQIAALERIREEHPALGTALDALYPANYGAQAGWTFHPLFGQEERPIDLVLTGRLEEATNTVNAIAHGAYL
ncbi:hypothetical protein D7I39_03105 [Allopusillimonas ginsengisoli]|nr:hypothetical protein D7I39_03105 [Allopusillimonas ginsengisoli]